MDDLLFLDDSEDSEPPAAEADEAGWVVLVVDDDPDVHIVTRMALQHFRFQGHPLKFVGCYSASETLAILPTLPDLALILLDIVMEGVSSGTELARKIRATPRYDKVQIVVRTASGGYGGTAAFSDIPIHAFIWKHETGKAELEHIVADALAAHCAATPAPA